MKLETLFEFLPYVVLLFLILMNRRDLERESRALSPEHRRGMDEKFNPHRFIQYGALVIVLASIFLQPTQTENRIGLPALQVTALIAWSVSAFAFGRGILTRLEIPEPYVKAYTRDRLLLLLLLGFFTFRGAWELWARG